MTGSDRSNSMDQWISHLFERADMLEMGHLQRKRDRNLGMGWLYYALARMLRPRLAVVIGSYRGFVPLVLGKAMADNPEGGQVVFIDPSLVDDFWKDARAVEAHFANHEIQNIRHYLMTTQAFVESPAYAELRQIDILFVDGYHSYEQARFDYEAFQSLLTPAGVVLFHDSVRVRESGMYDKPYEHRVKHFIDELKTNPELQVMDFPLSDGVTLVRKVGPIPPYLGSVDPETAADAARTAST